MSDGDINVDSIDGEVSTSANIVGQLYPQGEKGDKGDPGNDGFSPTVTTEKVGKTTTITITDAEGEHVATILDGADGQGSGDMRTEVYDINQNGIVDDAEKVNGHTVGIDVPANAVFTDTTYTAGTGIDITNGVITNTQTSAEWGNITGTLSDQTDLKNALDDKADTSDLATVATSGDYSDLLNKPSIPTNTSDLTNNSGFIDKDVNNLTNYDTSTTVDTKISNSEEVLIGSDSGIKASHELWVDTNDVTPYINSEISNEYGTAQNLGYSQEYVNTKLSEKLDATGTATNSTKWNGTTNDVSTENNADTWIPVLNGVKLQHTTMQNIQKKSNVFYSSENAIGTWVNGKPLYRQTFCFRNLAKNTETSLSWNNSVYGNSLTNANEIVNYRAFYKRYKNGSFDTFQQVPTVHSSMALWGSGIYDLSVSGFRFWVGSLASDYTIYELVITIEYTKTTD